MAFFRLFGLFFTILTLAGIARADQYGMFSMDTPTADEDRQSRYRSPPPTDSFVRRMEMYKEKLSRLRSRVAMAKEKAVNGMDRAIADVFVATTERKMDPNIPHI
jgi:hypothetical protein